MANRDVIVTPHQWLPRGEAVVRAQRPLVVWGGIPGEPAVVQITHRGTHQGLGRFMRPAGEPHPRRREPPCDRFGPCGGCPLMHLTREGQERARLWLVRDALAEHGFGDLAPEAIQGSPDGDEGFRHVVKLAAGFSDLGQVRIGAYGRNTHRIVPIPSCNVATPTLRKAMSVVSYQMRELGIAPYDPERASGLLRYLVLRQSRATGEVLVTIVAAHRQPILWEYAERIAGGLSEATAIHLHLNDGPGNAIFMRDAQGLGDTRRLRGKDVIEEEVAAVRLRIGPSDFFQTNPGVADGLIRDVVDALAPDRDRPVVDLYCGVGAVTLPLARAHGWALGVEVSDEAVDRARENAALNKLAAEFIAGPTLDVLPEVARRLDGRPPVVVVDPARRGLEDGVVEGVLDLNPARVVYISCNPRALARDLARFAAAGWTASRVRAYDMFPQTSHVELMTVLSPPEAPPEGRRSPRRRVVRGAGA